MTKTKSTNSGKGIVENFAAATGRIHIGLRVGARMFASVSSLNFPFHNTVYPLRTDTEWVHGAIPYPRIGTGAGYGTVLYLRIRTEAQNSTKIHLRTATDA